MVNAIEMKRLIDVTIEELELGKFGIGVDEMGRAPGERLTGLRKQLKELTNEGKMENEDTEYKGGLRWK